MKNLEYYMGLNYKIEVVKDETEDGYVLSIPELKGCLTCTDNLEKGMELIKDAKSSGLWQHWKANMKYRSQMYWSNIPGSSSFVSPNPSIRNCPKNQGRKVSV